MPVARSPRPCRRCRTACRRPGRATCGALPTGRADRTEGSGRRPGQTGTAQTTDPAGAYCRCRSPWSLRPLPVAAHRRAAGPGRCHPPGALPTGRADRTEGGGRRPGQTGTAQTTDRRCRLTAGAGRPGRPGRAAGCRTARAAGGRATRAALPTGRADRPR
ncbi:hypothetical protein MPRG_49980 [Mycobacterium paragordonae]|uniref:Uncharacterized protein n=1 Tax=Mycobacterium paragordonae TaxID=1389713 RepID=A0ABQ1CBM9_9MYCO|nr:hypothetical protein MPRG_49980 [Mycobacterium paragordonae]